MLDDMKALKLDTAIALQHHANTFKQIEHQLDLLHILCLY